MTVWHNALVLRSPASRDYADWMEPYFKLGALETADFGNFWMEAAAAEALPLNRLTGIVSFYQMQQKITHGNAADQIHVTNWLLNDLFLTADRAFHAGLVKVAAHFPKAAMPVFIDRAGASCFDLRSGRSLFGTAPALSEVALTSIRAFVSEPALWRFSATLNPDRSRNPRRWETDEEHSSLGVGFGMLALFSG